ncbi:hypothetical protein KA005_71630, partial [bacterium]|nr:hypothetical protein [bacterium]
SRCHWREKAEAAKIAKEQGLYGVLEITCLWPKDKAPPTVPMFNEFEAQYTFYPPDKRRRDQDNYSAMMKSYQDGVCIALGVDDSCFQMAAPVWGEVVKGGKVMLTLEELNDE